MTALDPCLAVIPARGGSKGLPGKNIRPLCGLPLIAHAIECAKRVPRIARTIISTDSNEIAEVARAHGGDVPFLRPAELAQDGTPTMPVLVHALDELARGGQAYASLLLLEPTSPGRLPEDIDAAFAALDADPGADGAIGCSQPSFNPFYVGVVEQQGYLARAFPGIAAVRRQDVPPFLRINGTLYLWRSELVRRTQASWLDAGRYRAVEVPEQRAFSIDDLWEFQLAELAIGAGLVRLPWLTA